MPEIKHEMDFQNLNYLNAFVNMLSGNFLPVTNKKTKIPNLLKIYIMITWLIQVMYVVACTLGLFNAPRERVLKDGTVNILVFFEVIVLTIYLHNHKEFLHELIGKLNGILAVNDEVLKQVTINTVKPLEKPLKIYTISSISSVMVWTSLAFVKVFQKNEFNYTDYQIPAVISKEPFPIGIFIGGVLLEIFGGGYTIIRKISLDLYTMHLILLMTAQYKYVRIKLATILQRGRDTTVNLDSDITYYVEEELRLLTRHYETVVELSVMLRKLLSPNIGILYVDYVFRFCFLSFMFVTTTTVNLEKYIITLYTINALAQFYVLCFCIQELFEASTSVADDVVHEKWYIYNIHIQHATAMIISVNKLECKLSSVRNINLNLSSFMSILNQAYSVSLLFLKTN
ncbi:uncharacterized protein LOC143422804 [Xylocopa sonorina]|uniref:uncharacterized protein LOC143422804 n=1 Tax=Xylocopa sonorina TaxID=1818115 RepID=UPI00403AFF0C